jgi:hypothetical protein
VNPVVPLDQLFPQVDQRSVEDGHGLGLAGEAAHFRRKLAADIHPGSSQIEKIQFVVLKMLSLISDNAVLVVESVVLLLLEEQLGYEVFFNIPNTIVFH